MLKINKKIYLILIIAVTIFIVIFIVILLNDNDSIIVDSDVKEEEIYEFVSPTSEYRVIYEVHEKYKFVELKDNKTGESKVIDTDSVNVDFSSFLWTDDGARFYLAKYNPDFSQSNEFFYIDVNDYDPYALAGISYEDPENIFKGKVIINKIEDNLLYLDVENRTYILDFSKGVSSKPVPL